MGLGLFTSEELIYDEQTGRLLTNRTWNYKIPGVKDIPIDFRVEMRKNAPNPVGVLKSKATGEPPLCMSSGVVFALRSALESARKDAGLPDDYFNIELPLTAEKLWKYAGTKVEGMHL
uniref:Aldehyde oxidase/xanthine dehydrogenase second molybdopterin binding domain-containing protein n=1 Tax=Graphocephala atropunctata TaxID=36148 RepID=A0A1B6MR86_9HEMI